MGNQMVLVSSRVPANLTKMSSSKRGNQGNTALVQGAAGLLRLAARAASRWHCARGFPPVGFPVQTQPQPHTSYDNCIYIKKTR